MTPVASEAKLYRLRPATPDDYAELRECHAAQKEWLGCEDDYLPFPSADWPTLVTFVVENDAGEIEGALYFEVALEAQVVLRRPDAMRWLAAQQGFFREHFDARGMENVTCRAFVPRAAARKMRHTLKRAHFEPMDFLYSTYIHRREV